MLYPLSMLTLSPSRSLPFIVYRRIQLFSPVDSFYIFRYVVVVYIALMVGIAAAATVKTMLSADCAIVES